jgi:hypothetical protein
VVFPAPPFWLASTIVFIAIPLNILIPHRVAAPVSAQKLPIPTVGALRTAPRLLELIDACSDLGLRSNPVRRDA